LPFATEETYLHATDRAQEQEVSTLLTVLIGAELYGLPTEVVREIIKVGIITEVPRLPSFLLGVISVRGAIIPVIDLRDRLGLDAGQGAAGSRIVIIATDGQRLGLQVDGVVGLQRFRLREIEPAPSIFGGGRVGSERYITGLGRAIEHPERIVSFLNLGPLLAIRDELGRDRRAPPEANRR
jgi:purine-binding chemotaxis protein CheW